MNYNTIHETVIKDIMDIISDGIDAKDSISGKATSISKSSSLSKATSGLTLVFPVLGSKNNSYETNAMIVKAVERQCVSLLQIAFSAFNITNTQDATQYIKQFHTNLGNGKMTLDAFIDIMDEYVQENGLLPKVNAGMYIAVLEDLKNLSYYFGEDISESSLNSYKVKSTGMSRVIVQEAPRVTQPVDPQNVNPDDMQTKAHVAFDRLRAGVPSHDTNGNLIDDTGLSQGQKDDNQVRQTNHQNARDAANDKFNREKWGHEYDQKEREMQAKARRDNMQNAKDVSDMLNCSHICSSVAPTLFHFSICLRCGLTFVSYFDLLPTFDIFFHLHKKNKGRTVKSFNGLFQAIVISAPLFFSFISTQLYHKCDKKAICASIRFNLTQCRQQLPVQCV